MRDIDFLGRYQEELESQDDLTLSNLIFRARSGWLSRVYGSALPPAPTEDNLPVAVSDTRYLNLHKSLNGRWEFEKTPVDKRLAPRQHTFGNPLHKINMGVAIIAGSGIAWGAGNTLEDALKQAFHLKLDAGESNSIEAVKTIDSLATEIALGGTSFSEQVMLCPSATESETNLFTYSNSRLFLAPATPGLISRLQTSNTPQKTLILPLASALKSDPEKNLWRQMICASVIDLGAQDIGERYRRLLQSKANQKTIAEEPGQGLIHDTLFCNLQLDRVSTGLRTLYGSQVNGWLGKHFGLFEPRWDQLSQVNPRLRSFRDWIDGKNKAIDAPWALPDGNEHSYICLDAIAAEIAQTTQDLAAGLDLVLQRAGSLGRIDSTQEIGLRAHRIEVKLPGFENPLFIEWVNDYKAAIPKIESVRQSGGNESTCVRMQGYLESAQAIDQAICDAMEYLVNDPGENSPSFKAGIPTNHQEAGPENPFE